MKVATTRFGEVSIPDEEIYQFPDGLLGFASVKQYFILKHGGKGPFLWLQAVEPGSLAFVVTDPLVFKPDYRVKVTQEDLDSVRLERLEDAMVFVILVVPKDPRLITANLQGPLLFNPKKRIARQLVLQGEEYTTRYRVFPDTSAAGSVSGHGK